MSAAVSVGKWPAGLDRFADLGVDTLYRIRRVDHRPDLGIEAEERHELRPRVLPKLHNGGVAALPTLGEVGQSLQSGGLRRGGESDPEPQMTVDATRMCDLLVGLEGMTVLAVDEAGEQLRVMVESTARFAGCVACGTRATVKDRPVVELGDLASFGRPATLVWRKRRWCCPDRDCAVGSWTETNLQVAAPRCLLTRRAGL